MAVVIGHRWAGVPNFGDADCHGEPAIIRQKKGRGHAVPLCRIPSVEPTDGPKKPKRSIYLAQQWLLSDEGATNGKRIEPNRSNVRVRTRIDALPDIALSPHLRESNRLLDRRLCGSGRRRAGKHAEWPLLTGRRRRVSSCNRALR